ncbi:hypothetical protein SH528x_001613 [Novipirellula sp. SH528]|uniref:hypothetical protein n=1 Tax=Novipirellula sp. SH528 TaxID=3454466 RepID=UPI003FA116D8
MSRLSVLVAATLFSFCVLPGCGGSSAPKNIAEDADAAAIAEYEAAVAAESAGMNESTDK